VSNDHGPHIQVLNIGDGQFPDVTALPVRRDVEAVSAEPCTPGDAGFDSVDVDFPVRWLRRRSMGYRGVPLAAGLLDMQPCVLDFTFVGDETILLVTGAIDVVDQSGNVARLRSGDMAYFASGTKTTWNVLEQSLELFTILG
jgi:hypothetical protein